MKIKFNSIFNNAETTINEALSHGHHKSMLGYSCYAIELPYKFFVAAAQGEVDGGGECLVYPDNQREFRATPAAKTTIITGLYDGSAPAIYINVDTVNMTVEILDGQQRTKTIIEFTSPKLFWQWVHGNLSGYSSKDDLTYDYKKLDSTMKELATRCGRDAELIELSKRGTFISWEEEKQEEFLNKTLTAFVFFDLTDDEKNYVYWSLNCPQGKTKMHNNENSKSVMTTEFRDVLHTYVSNPVFDELNVIDKRVYEKAISLIAMLVFKHNKNCSSSKISKMIDEYIATTSAEELQEHLEELVVDYKEMQRLGYTDLFFVSNNSSKKKFTNVNFHTAIMAYYDYADFDSAKKHQLFVESINSLLRNKNTITFDNKGKNLSKETVNQTGKYSKFKTIMDLFVLPYTEAYAKSKERTYKFSAKAIEKVLAKETMGFNLSEERMNEVRFLLLENFETLKRED